MKYNNNKSLTASKKGVYIRIGAIASICVLIAILWIVLIPHVQNFADELTINELIACITLILSLGTIAMKISEKILQQNYKPKRRISLDADTKESFTVITCRIENCGTKRIIPQNIYLIVEQGLDKEGRIDFPYLLKHEEGEFDCVLARICKAGGITGIPEHLISSQFSNLYRSIVKMQYLSSESILFVDPGEEFSEDVTLKLQKGVYRATVVWTSVKEDCICTTKEFIV